MTAADELRSMVVEILLYAKREKKGSVYLGHNMLNGEKSGAKTPEFFYPKKYRSFTLFGSILLYCFCIFLFFVADAAVAHLLSSVGQTSR